MDQLGGAVGEEEAKGEKGGKAATAEPTREPKAAAAAAAERESGSVSYQLHSRR